VSGTGKKWRPWLCAIAVAAASGSAGCTATLERPEFDARTLSARVVGLRSEARASYALIQKHIEDVGYQLAHSGAPICGEAVAPLLGASLARRNDFVLHAKKAQVEAAFGVGDRVKVFAVAGGSPAERAGLRAGDEIVAVDGRSITRTKHVFEALRRSSSGDPLFRVLREGTAHSLSLPRELGCDSGLRVYVSSSIDTSSDYNERDVWVPTGLVRFVKNDDELAIAIAHQIAHRLVGSFHRLQDEPRIDSLALVLSARAGFTITHAAGFWDRVAAEQPWKIPLATGGHPVDHGALELRAPVIRASVAEIQNLIAAGKPITTATSALR